MRILTPTTNLSRFFDDVQRADERALLLDYDGTLAPFRVQRDEAVPYPGVRQLLENILSDQRSRLIIISGRATSDLIPLLGLQRHPELWGSHGWERLLPDGRYELGDIGERATHGLAQARAVIESLGLADRCEHKPVSLALHWRGLDDATIETLRNTIMTYWTPPATEAGLHLHTFDGGIEVRAPGRDKGYAVRTILAEMQPNAAIAYLGDDLTDEDAFHALDSRGLRVLVRGELRPTAADVWLYPPEELLEFLQRWRQVCA
jgi:trehalose-phosphatase